MKHLCWCMIICILVLSGCSSQDSMEKPLQFYYQASELSYQFDSSAILSITVDAAQMGTDEDILKTYLKQPSTEQFRSPFPAGLSLLNYQVEGNTVYLNLSYHLATLTNMDLTIACSCIAMTCLELTGAELVSIEADGQLLDGQKSILLQKNTTLLTDSSK